MKSKKRKQKHSIIIVKLEKMHPIKREFTNVYGSILRSVGGEPREFREFIIYN